MEPFRRLVSKKKGGKEVTSASETIVKSIVTPRVCDNVSRDIPHWYVCAISHPFPTAPLSVIFAQALLLLTLLLLCGSGAAKAKDVVEDDPGMEEDEKPITTSMAFLAGKLVVE
jgi:hypothetical protein